MTEEKGNILVQSLLSIGVILVISGLFAVAEGFTIFGVIQLIGVAVTISTGIVLMKNCFPNALNHMSFDL